MSSKFTTTMDQTIGGMKTGLENPSIPEGFDIPSCGIEDVDRAVFKLFNEDIPLYFDKDKDLHRIPCIFASGERAFILRRQQPLRDKQGALILPLVSILRNGIDQDTDKRPISQGNGELIIKKRLAPENSKYKEYIDKIGETNYNLNPSKSSIWEYITIPTPRFFKANYEITFWSSYLQQMNHMLEAFMSSYNIDITKSFRIESPKGYWFVAQVESGLGDGGNADNYLDSERLIKTTITLSVTGYIINPKFPGAPNMLRRYVSVADISFDVDNNPKNIYGDVPVKSGNPEDYQYEDIYSLKDPLPGQGIGGGVVDGDVDVNIGGEKIHAKLNNEQVVKTII